MSTLATNTILLDQTDIWVAKILPFLGPGHYIFVAGVNKRFKELYQQYFSKIKKIPAVKIALGDWRTSPAIATALCGKWENKERAGFPQAANSIESSKNPKNPLSISTTRRSLLVDLHLQSTA